MKFKQALASIIFALSAFNASATCNKHRVMNYAAAAANAATIQFGRVNLSDSYIQPPGTMMAGVMVPATAFHNTGAHAGSVLWTCDKADYDSGKVYFLVSVNADSRFGGQYSSSEMEGVFHTWFDYVGLKLVMNDVTLGRYWQKVELTSFATVTEKKKERIQIRLGDIPALQAELYRLNQPTPIGGGLPDCGGNEKNPTGNGRVYECGEPNGYIQLVGPNLIHDRPGTDHRVNYRFWGGDNGFGYRLKNGMTLHNTNTCRVTSGSQVVKLPIISVTQLENGGSAVAGFNVAVECHHGVSSSTNKNGTVIGFVPSAGALQAAQQLGLVNSSGGVEYLLSDKYTTDSTMAKGVGIQLYNQSNQMRYFASNPKVSPGSDTQSGWYPVLDEGSSAPSAGQQHLVWNNQYIVHLKKLPGVAVTPGRVKASATVTIGIK